MIDWIIVTTRFLFERAYRMKPYRGCYRHPVNPLTNCKVIRIFKPAGLNLHLKQTSRLEVQRAMEMAFRMTSSTPTGLEQARTPFEFKSAAHLLFIETEQVTNLEELSQALRTCPDASIFQHTFRTLEEHHYIKEGFSNDFAQWAYTDLREVGLGERLTALDVREFTSLGKLRERLIQIVEEFMAVTPRAKDRHR